MTSFAYSTVLCVHCSLVRTGFTVMVDHETLCRACRRNLGIELNRLLTQVTSSRSAPLRYGGALNVGVSESQTNLCLSCEFLYASQPEDPPCTAEPLARAGHLLPDRISAFRWSTVRGCYWVPTNLVPYPRYHFMYAVRLHADRPAQKAYMNCFTVAEISMSVCQPGSLMGTCVHHPKDTLSGCLLYHVDMVPQFSVRRSP